MQQHTKQLLCLKNSTQLPTPTVGLTSTAPWNHSRTASKTFRKLASNSMNKPSLLLPSSPADKREFPARYVLAFLTLCACDVAFLYRMADTPFEFLAILALLAITSLSAVEAASRL